MNWLTLDPAQAQELTTVRLPLQAAVQLVSAVGFSLAQPQTDDSYTSLLWEEGRLMGILIPAPTPLRAALDPLSFTLLLLNGEGKPLAELPLTGQTLNAALTWLQQQLAHCGVFEPRLTLGEYPPALQNHPLTQGEPFPVTPESLRMELMAYFNNSLPLLQSLVQSRSIASPCSIWPHNFDMATLLSFPEGKTIGIGLSTGDSGYPEPYWYITLYPYPSPPFPALAGAGSWHIVGWVGAVLKASQLSPTAAEQLQQVQDFIQSAVSASEHLLAVV